MNNHVQVNTISLRLIVSIASLIKVITMATSPVYELMFDVNELMFD